MNTKVSFIVPSLDEYLSVLTFFILESGWSEKIFSVYPSLKEKLKNSKDKKKTIELFFKKQETKFMPVMNVVQKEFQNSWDKINHETMQTLEEINETKFSLSQKEFTARITLNPICPRYLDKNSFDIYFALAERTMRTLVLHELSHFIFFKKFKEIYPKVNVEEFENPHLIWKLSETIPAVIFNDKRIIEIFEVQEEVLVYKSISKLKIDNILVIDILKDFYNNRKNFEDFIRKSYNFFKKNEDKLKL
jgi:hypothetical protein